MSGGRVGAGGFCPSGCFQDNRDKLLVVGMLRLPWLIAFLAKNVMNLA